MALSTVNPHGLTGTRPEAMPPLAPDQARWRAAAPPVWVGRAVDSGVLIGSGAQRPSFFGQSFPALPRSTAGGASHGARCRPRLVLTRSRTTPYFEVFFGIRPSGTSTNNWTPEQGNLDSGSRLLFEWIAPGLTAQSFWSARTVRVPRWKAALVPSCAGLALSRLTPNRCLAGCFWPRLRACSKLRCYQTRN